MSPYHKKQKDKRRKNLFRKWHRRIGFTVAIFLFNLAVTGILLNHSDDLELHKQYIESDWLVNFYGIKAPSSGQCIGGNKAKTRICQLGSKIYFGENQLVSQATSLVGLVEFDDLFYLATSSDIYIYTKDFSLVENLNQQMGLPIPISGIKLVNQPLKENSISELLISTDQDSWSLDQESLSWNKSDFKLKSSTPLTALQGEKLALLQNKYLDSQITRLKFIQDLHSGRIFSLPGKLLTDLVGVITILLAISGFFAWQRRKDKIK